MKTNVVASTSTDLKKDDLIVVAGAGGFIAGALGPFPRPGFHPNPRRG